MQLEKCVKCKSNTSQVCIRLAHYCNNCFTEQAYSKYRQKINKSGLSPSKVLVAFDPFDKSCALLKHFTEKSQSFNRDLSFDFVYVEENDSLNTGGLNKDVKIINWPILLSEFLQRINKADQKEFRNIFLRRTILDYAISHDYNCVYFATGCSQQAIDMMADICSGRGVSVAWRLSSNQKVSFDAYEDSEGVSFLYPMSELIEEEIDYYLESCLDHSPLFVEGVVGKGDGIQSIHSLCHKFIKNLQRDNSATVSTICRTLSKIKSNVDSGNTKPCRLCLFPLSTQGFCYGCQQLIDRIDSNQTLNLLTAHLLKAGNK